MISLSAIMRVIYRAFLAEALIAVLLFAGVEKFVTVFTNSQ
jgi:hypothetical protein